MKKVLSFIGKLLSKAIGLVDRLWPYVLLWTSIVHIARNEWPQAIWWLAAGIFWRLMAVPLERAMPVNVNVTMMQPETLNGTELAKQIADAVRIAERN